MADFHFAGGKLKKVIKYYVYGRQAPDFDFVQTAIKR
jgi:hypothetical protein